MAETERRRTSRGPVSWLLMTVIMTTVLLACSADYDDHDHPRLTTGTELYNHHCADCHGEDGTGKLVDRTPANILTKRSRDGIVSYIIADAHGRQDMPAFRTMPYSEAIAIADHLLVLQRLYAETAAEKKKLRALMIEP